MRFYIHIPTLEEFALYAACDGITEFGAAGLNKSMPYVLYLRCIDEFAEKHGKNMSLKKIYDRQRVNWHMEVVPHFATRMASKCMYKHVVRGKLGPIAELDYLMRKYDGEDVVQELHQCAARCQTAGQGKIMLKMMDRALKCHPSKAIIDFLLHYGAELDPHDEDYVYDACANGMHDIVKSALDRGNALRYDHLEFALKSGDLDTVRLVAGALGWERHLDHHYQPMPWGSIDMLDMLLSLGVLTPGIRYDLSLVESVQIIRWFFEHDMVDSTDLMVSRASRAAIREHNADGDLLHYLIEERQIPVPKDIFARMQADDSTAAGVIDYLRHHGADIYAKDSNGQCIAARSPLLIRYWMDVGVDVARIGFDIVSQCIRRHVTTSVISLIMRLANVNASAVDVHGTSLLHVACQSLHADAVSLLLSIGANVNAINVYGDKPGNEMDDRHSSDKMPQVLAIMQLLRDHGYVHRTRPQHVQ